MIVLHEKLTLPEWTGVFLTMAGLVISELKSNK
jgi:drug/metabolite transporter (DMT)-like permease